MSEVVQQRVEEGVAVLTLNRPERLNAWTQEMERTYFGLLDDCAARDDVRVIVVTGAGRGFCAGADMEALQSLGQDGVQDADRVRRGRDPARTDRTRLWPGARSREC